MQISFKSVEPYRTKTYTPEDVMKGDITKDHKSINKIAKQRENGFVIAKRSIISNDEHKVLHKVDFYIADKGEGSILKRIAAFVHINSSDPNFLNVVKVYENAKEMILKGVSQPTVKL